MSAADAFEGELDDADDEAPVATRRQRASAAAVLVPVVALVVAVYVEIALAIDARVLGAVPDLALIVVVAIALRFGPIAGSAAGFAAGLMIDIAVQGPIGASALVLTPLGWAAGWWSDRRRRVSLAMAVVVLAVATAAAIAGDALVALAVEGQNVAWGPLAVRAVAEVALTLLIGIPSLALLRRVAGVRTGGAA